jgi:hypothetical protein
MQKQQQMLKKDGVLMQMKSLISLVASILSGLKGNIGVEPSILTAQPF